MSCNSCNKEDCNCFAGIKIPQGPIGPKGDVGATGAAGEVGPSGLTGAAGAVGSTGADSVVPGPEGVAGADGLDGAVGDQGIQGIQGPIGLTGNQGIIGLTGAAGANGTNGVNAFSLDDYISDAANFTIPAVSTLIPLATVTVGSGTGDYLVQFELYMSVALPDKVELKVGGVTIDTLDLSVLGITGLQNISTFWVGNVNDGQDIEIFVEDAGNTAVVELFKMGVFRLG